MSPPSPPRSPFVRSIAVSQLPSHLELSQLLKYCLSDLTHLRLSYGALHCGMDYERSLFGMTLQDVQGLAAQLPLVETLCALDLTNSVLDDEKARGRDWSSPGRLPWRLGLELNRQQACLRAALPPLWRAQRSRSAHI